MAIVGLLILLAITALLVAWLPGALKRAKIENESAAKIAAIKKHWHLITGLYKSGRFQEAINMFTPELVGQDSDGSALYKDIGDCYAALQQWKEATEKYEQGLQLPTVDYYRDQLHERLSVCRFNLHEFDKSISHAQRVSAEYIKDAVKFGNYSLLLAAGNSFVGKEQYAIAIEWYKKAPVGKREIDHRLTEVIYDLGVAYQLAGNHKMALKQFEKVYASDINYKDVESKIAELGELK